MKLSDRFSVEPQRDVNGATSANETTPATVRVLLDGQASRCIVGGEELEAAIACDDKFLLVLNDGVFWEEGLNIHLLGPDLQLLDSVSMGWPYTPGILTKLSLQAPDAIEFSFPGETRWRVRVLPERKWRMPRPTWFSGVSRPLSWWHWLELTELSR